MKTGEKYIKMAGCNGASIWCLPWVPKLMETCKVTNIIVNKEFDQN